MTVLVLGKIRKIDERCLGNKGLGLPLYRTTLGTPSASLALAKAVTTSVGVGQVGFDVQLVGRAVRFLQ